MNFSMENVQKLMHEFIAKNSAGKDLSDDEMNALLQDFINNYNSTAAPLTEKTASSASDFLELAKSAASATKRKKYLDKAAALEPDNIDVLFMKLTTEKTTADKILANLEKLEIKAENQLKEDDYFCKDCIGHFWQILETRPYMRILLSIMQISFQCGFISKAIDYANKIIKLNEGDNNGARYMLFHCYAHFEDIKSTEKLNKKYPDELSIHALLPQALLYYRIGDNERAASLIKEICEYNKNAKKCFADLAKRQYPKNSPLSSYALGSKEEIFNCVFEYDMEYDISPLFFDWCSETAKKFATAKKNR